jgi:hypothetical protein
MAAYRSGQERLNNSAGSRSGGSPWLIGGSPDDCVAARCLLIDVSFGRNWHEKEAK